MQTEASQHRRMTELFSNHQRRSDSPGSFRNYLQFRFPSRGETHAEKADYRSEYNVQIALAKPRVWRTSPPPLRQADSYTLGARETIFSDDASPSLRANNQLFACFLVSWTIQSGQWDHPSGRRTVSGLLWGARCGNNRGRHLAI